MRRIPLSKGLFALVDDEDFERLAQYRWRAQKSFRTFYAVRTEKRDGGRRGTVYMHRLILDPPDGLQVDHEDGHGLNNTRENLRVVTSGQNCNNLTRKRDGCSSKYRGVSWWKLRGKWDARIQCDGKVRHLGYFDSEEDAARAYNAAGLERDPVHFTPNIIEEPN